MAEPRSDARPAWARAVLRGVVLAAGVIAGALLGSGLAAAGEDTPSQPQPPTLSITDPLGVVRSSLGSSLDSSLGASLGTSLSSLARPAVRLPADLGDAVAGTLPALEPAGEVLRLPSVVAQPLVADAAAGRPVPSVAPVPVAPVGNTPSVERATAGDVVADVDVDVVAPAARPAAVPAYAMVDTGVDNGRVSVPRAAASASPDSPDPEPTAVDLPCEPTPALPVPTTQLNTVSAVEANPAEQPAGGWRHVGIARGGVSPTVAIAEDPGETPD